ncbi:MAG: hypothetical protein EA403_01035 [Spirochaetaceae bacterium]|nr:MAG: hypothetical protein EA403_01035 [Spirochaetaceae bacterium]
MGASVARVGAVLAFVLAGSATLHALEVTSSQGQAELRAGDTPWRRAVIGRPIGAGTTLSTWRDSAIIAERDGIRLDIAPFTQIEVTSVLPGTAILLHAGRIDVQVVEASDVSVEVGGFTVRATDASFTVNRRGATVREGTITVTGPSGTASVISAPGSVSFVLHSP